MRFIIIIIFSELCCYTALAQNEVYISTDAYELYVVDVSNCSAQLIGHTSALLFDLAINPVDGTLYGVSSGNGFYEIDASTAGITYIGNTVNSINALVFSDSGILYGMGDASDTFYTINTVTGAATSLGSTGTGIVSSGDLTFYDGKLYLCGSPFYLVEINIDMPSNSIVLGYFFGLVETYGVTAIGCPPLIHVFDQNDIYRLPPTNLLQPQLACGNIIPFTNIYGAAALSENISMDKPRLGNDTSMCYGETLMLDATSPNATYSWQDNSTGHSYTITRPGTYWVEVMNICGTVSDTIIISPETKETTENIVTCNPADVGVVVQNFPDPFGCDSIHTIITTLSPFDSMYVSQATCNLADTGVAVLNLFNQHGCDSTVTITTTLTQPDTINISEVTCDASNAGADTMILQNRFGCDSLTIITTNPSPLVSITQNIFICEGNAFEIAGVSQTSTGTYVDTFPDANGCDSVVIVNLTVFPVFADSVIVTIQEGGQVSGIQILRDTIIIRELSTALNCDSMIITFVDMIESSISFPSAFSPNGDEVNDIFRPVTQFITDFHLMIFNRWGEKVFESNNYKNGWDGTYKGGKAEIGVYAYYAEVGNADRQNKTYQGTVTLIR